MEYHKIIGGEIFQLGYGIETSESPGSVTPYTVRAYNDEETFIASSDTLLNAFKAVKSLIVEQGE